MKKLFSFMLIAVGLLISGNAKAVDVAALSINDGDPTYYESFGDAFKAANDAEFDSEITLLKGFTFNEKDLMLSNGKHVTINMNNQKIYIGKSFRLFHGTLEFTGTGTIEGTEEEGQFFWLYGSPVENIGEYTVLTIGKDITVQYQSGLEWWAAVVITFFPKANKTPEDILPQNIKDNLETLRTDKSGSANGVKVNVHGKIYSNWIGISINGTIQQTKGDVPVINVYKGAVVEDRHVETSQNMAGYCGNGIYAAGYGIWNISGEVSGQCGIYAKAGKINLIGADVSATGPYLEPTKYNSGSAGGGDGIVLDSHDSYAGNIILTSTGDTRVEAVNGNAIHEVITSGTEEQTKAITLTSGTFIAGEGTDSQGQDFSAIKTTEAAKTTGVITVDGGTYSSDVTDYVDQSKGGIIVKSVDENGNEVFVISNTGTEEPVSWTSELLNATADSYVKLNSAVATEVNVNKDITCAFLAVEGWDKVIVKKGYTLTVGEVVLGETGVIEVESGAKLLVTGYKGLYSPAPENLILKADAEGMATFVFNPDVKSNNSPYATVEYLTDARQKSATSYTWNRFASVFDALSDYSTMNKEELAPYFDGQSWKTFFEYWDATADKWTSCVYNDGVPQLSAFVGYSLTNRSINGGAKYAFEGKLHGSKEANIKVKKGWNYFGNSFTAPMSMVSFIDQLKAADVEIDGVYFWNNEKKYYDAFNFYSIKEDGLGAYEKIPAMQTFIFYSNSDEEVDVTIDYKTSVWDINK